MHCGKATKAGVDEYDIASKTSYHAICQESIGSIPTREQYELAKRLGFLPTDEALRADWTLPVLSRTAGSASAGRDGTETRGDEDSL